MLTIHTRDPRGYVIHSRVFCETCEPLELADRLIAKLEQGRPVSIRLGHFGREELHHSDGEMTVWCDRCGTPRLE